MIINGRVEGMIKVFDDSVMYNVHDGIMSHKIRSVGKQAVKDAIFLREGYGIEVNGSLEDDTVLSEHSSIDITGLKGGFYEDTTGAGAKG